MINRLKNSLPKDNQLATAFILGLFNVYALVQREDFSEVPYYVYLGAGFFWWLLAYIINLCDYREGLK
jgi:hypothetical protein